MDVKDAVYEILGNWAFAWWTVDALVGEIVNIRWVSVDGDAAAVETALQQLIAEDLVQDADDVVLGCPVYKARTEPSA